MEIRLDMSYDEACRLISIIEGKFACYDGNGIQQNDQLRPFLENVLEELRSYTMDLSGFNVREKWCIIHDVFELLRSVSVVIFDMKRQNEKLIVRSIDLEQRTNNSDSIELLLQTIIGFYYSTSPNASCRNQEMLDLFKYHKKDGCPLKTSIIYVLNDINTRMVWDVRTQCFEYYKRELNPPRTCPYVTRLVDMIFSGEGNLRELLEGELVKDVSQEKKEEQSVSYDLTKFLEID